MTDDLSPPAAAVELGVSEKTLTKWRQARKGPPYGRISNDRVRYSKEAIERWRARQVTSIRYCLLDRAAA